RTNINPKMATAPFLKPNTRLLSRDAPRGFDRLVISGGAPFLVRLAGKTGLGYVEPISRKLVHPRSPGCTFYDFIFPLFLFIAGISLSFSLSSGIRKNIPKTALYRKVFVRMLILICLGILYKNAPIPFLEPSQIRFGSVLGRIGFAGFISC